MPPLPTFWVTQIAKVLVGEQPCLLSPWAKAWKTYTPQPRHDQAALTLWKAKHTGLLQVLRSRLTGDGWLLDIERFFRVEGKSAVVTGKADLIAKAKGKRPLVIDAKSGTPRDSDLAQVLCSMVLLPLAWGKPHLVFDGRVCYETHEVPLNPEQATALRPRLMEMLRRLGKPEQPEPSPGRDACRWCEVPESICAVRYSDELAAVSDEF